MMLILRRQEAYSVLSNGDPVPISAVYTFHRPENLGSDDEAGLHIRRRVGIAGMLRWVPQDLGHLSVLDDAKFIF